MKKLKKILKINKIDMDMLLICFIFWTTVIGMAFVYSGVHNIDISYNSMKILGDKIDQYYEIRMDGGKWSYQECYLTGLNQVIFGSMILALAGMFMGVAISQLRSNSRSNIKR